MLLLLAGAVMTPLERLDHVPPQIRSAFFKGTRETKYEKLVDLQGKGLEDGSLQFEFTVLMPDNSYKLITVRMYRDYTVEAPVITDIPYPAKLEL